MLATGAGFGMQRAPSVAAAFQKTKDDEKIVSPLKVCPQCQPSTNTWAYRAPYHEASCSRIPIHISALVSQTASNEGVLCISRGALLKYCGPDEFMAVSHVWAHGWKGTSEDGICSRTLDMLLDLAAKYGVAWVWLDVAMISKEKVARAMAINSMDTVYSTARITMVFDRLMLNFAGGNKRETALALVSTDWVTRVWTMQEALLSRRLVVPFKNGFVEPKNLMTAIVTAEDDTERWKAYRVIEHLDAMLYDKNPPLEKIVILSHQRLTTRAVDMVRALFPLFSLKWPDPQTTLIEGQIMLLKHIGPEASRLTSLNSPIGLPSPWGWAPLVIPGCNGAMTSLGRSITEDGLTGAWGWREVEPVRLFAIRQREGPITQPGQRLNHFRRSFQQSRQYRDGSSTLFDVAVGFASDIYKSAIITEFATWDSNPHSVRIADLTDMDSQIGSFKTVDTNEEFVAVLSFAKAEPWPWPSQRLMIVGSGTGSGTSSSREDIRYYDLVIVESTQDDLFILRRVGKLVGQYVKLNDNEQCIRALLH